MEIGSYPNWSHQVASLIGKPLNGEKTHPLKPALIAALKVLHYGGPAPQCALNAGIRDRLTREGLTREGLIEAVTLPSPFKSHNGKPYPHVQITEAGAAKVREIENP